MVEVFPDRQQWLEARRRGLGASDAAAILGISSYKSNVDLWKEKCGLIVPKDSRYTERKDYGAAAEEPLRRLFELDYPEYGLSFTPFKIISNDKYPFIFCTPDGELAHANGNGGLEIKAVEIARGDEWKKWTGQVPDIYYAQVCHQLIATGWEYDIVKAQIKYYKDGDMCIVVKHYYIDRADAQNDMDILLEAEIKFWDYVQRKKEPPLILPNIRKGAAL